MNAVDLFAGCGGLSKGFIDAGYQVLLGVDNDEAALKTFALNHPGATPVNADLSDEDELERLIGLASEQSVDVVIAGPPCQGFSLTGPRHFDDDRNRLYLAVFRMVKALRPKALVIENVPGMSTLYNGQIQAEILRRFRKLGYHIDSKILCAADFGVPQMRKRLIFIGIREDIGPVSFPAELVTPGHYVTCGEATSD